MMWFILIFAELPNLLDKDQVEMLRKWNGELRFLQNFKLVRLGKKNLQDDTSTSMDCSASTEANSKTVAPKNVKSKSNVNEDDNKME